jgi:spermidine synthase
VTPEPERAGLARLLYALSWVSGFAALLYQIAWSNLLSLSFGSSTLAVSSVVAGFLGGMGVGAFAWHRVERRARSPLAAYAALEVGIAISTALLTRVLERLPDVYAVLPVRSEDGSLAAVQIAGVLALLALPAALMGATYPALCLALIRSLEGVDRHLGVLYGLNTIGAAAGAAAGGLVGIEWLGASGCVAAANALNLAVGVVAWLASRRPGEARASREQPRADEAIPTHLPIAAAGLVLLGSGFATLAYEIVWFRALRYLVGNSTYALSVALVVFLLGLGAGALAHRRALRRPERNLGWIQLAIALLALLAIGAVHAILERADLRDALSVYSLSLRARPWWWRLGASASAAIAILLPATFAMGLVFPLAARLVLGSVGRLGARVGLATLLSNAGSIAGAIFAATWLLPRLGTVGSTRTLALVNVALGLLTLACAGLSGRQRVAGVLAGASILGLAAALPPRLPFVGELLLVRVAPQMLFEEESELGTVQVRAAATDPAQRVMTIDGSLIAATPGVSDAHRKQELLAHLPMALDRGARSALNVGVASCSTLRTLAAYPWLERLDGVEINPAVMRAALLFEESSVLADPRVSVAVEDAVHFLLATSEQYDVIVSDAKQNVDFSGNAKILSREFYRFALRRLAPCGLFVQWIPLANSPAGFELVLRTFRDVFPEVELFYDPPTSLLMAGSLCPIAGRPFPSPDELEAAGISRLLSSLGMRSRDDLLHLWIASGADVARDLGPGPLNTWDRMPLAFVSYRARFAQNAGPNLGLLLGGGGPESLRTSPFGPADSPAQRSRALAQHAMLDHFEGRSERARQLAQRAVAASPGLAYADTVRRQLSAAERALP